MKKTFTITTLALVFLMIGILAVVGVFGQGPRNLNNKTSEDMKTSETISNVTQTELKTGESGQALVKEPQRIIPECPSREQMLRQPILSIECYLYKEYFDEAYELYPSIPRGVLEAVASQNGFVHSMYSQEQEESWDHHSSPLTYTVMDYYDVPEAGEYYNNLSKIINYSDYSRDSILMSPRISILSYAQALSVITFGNSDIDSLLLGVAQLDAFPLGSDANASAIKRVVRFLNNPDYRSLMQFPQYILPGESDYYQSLLKSGGFSCGDYTGVDSTEIAASCNYGTRSSSSSIDKVAIHTIGGAAGSVASIESAVNWFQNCVSQVSAHYAIGGYPIEGQNSDFVFQAVCEVDKAQHIGLHNSISIGIEHEGTANFNYFSEELYQESADLVKDIASRYPNINRLATYTGPAHSVTTLLPECLDIKGHQHFDISGNSASSKYDPGDTWDWFYYYGRINDNPIQMNYSASSGSFFDSGGSGGNYGALQNRVYKIDPGVSDVSLSITQFNLGPGDYMWIYSEPNPTIEPNPHNNTTDLGIGSNAPGDIPVANFYTGSLLDLPQTTFTSHVGGFYIIFRSDCSVESSGFGIVWTTDITMACTDNHEPNGNQSQAHQTSLIGSGVPMSETLQACVTGTSDDDWYITELLEPGLLTVTLSEQGSQNLNLESVPSVPVTTLANGDKQLTFCHAGNMCYPLYIRVWDPGWLPAPDSPYEITFDWDPDAMCTPDNLSAPSGGTQIKSGSTGLTISNVTTNCTSNIITAQVSGGSGMYEWYLDGTFAAAVTGSSVTLFASAPGPHTILVLDYNNTCYTAWDDITIASSTATLTISPASPSIIQGSGVQLFASGGSSYSWSPATGLSNTSVWNPIASPSVTTTYTVTATDASGCSASESVTVVVSGLPPAAPMNDGPCSATVLSVGVNSCSFEIGSNVGATNSGVTVDPLCAGTSLSGNATGNYAGGDVWYKAWVPSNGMLIVQTQQQSSLNDAVIAAYTGSCSNLSMIACADDQSSTNFMPLMTLSGLTPNTWVHIRVWEFGNNTFGSFGICAMTPGGSNGGGSSEPNLSVTSFSVSDHTVDQGDNVTVNFTVENTGTQTSPACSYMCGLADAFVAHLTVGGLMRFASIPSLTPGSDYSFSLNLSIPQVDDGVYYLVVGVDEPFDDVSESNENDNLVGNIITVGNATPDLADLDVSDTYLSQTNNLQPGLPWRVGIEVENDGTDDAPGTTARIVLSDDSNYDPGIDILIWDFNTADLDPGEYDYDEKFVTFPAVPHAGTWRVLFIADVNHQIAEADEGNNMNIRTISVLTINPATADYVTSIDNLKDKTTGLFLVNNEIEAGHELEIFTGTTNQGLIRNQTASRTQFYLSPLPYVNGMMAFIGSNTHSSAGINVGDTDNSTPDDPLTGVQLGPNYIIALTDVRDDIYEGPSGESNNITVAPITVISSYATADLVPQILSVVPYSNALGDMITVTTRIYNYGDTIARNFDFRHWISLDPIFDHDEIDGRLEQTIYSIDSLLPGDSIDVVRTMRLDNDPAIDDIITGIGQYYVIAVVDDRCEDVIEQSVLNNMSVMPVYIHDISCFIFGAWSAAAQDTIDWDEYAVGWLFTYTPEDCQHTIHSSPWMLSPQGVSSMGEDVVYVYSSDNMTGMYRTGYIFSGTDTIGSFIQRPEPSMVLPVTWISVDAYEFEGSALIYWRVGVEHSVEHYRIERSFDGIHFESIGYMNPFNRSNSTYRYEDKWHDHIVYYRVIAVDYDGSEDASAIVALDGYRPHETSYNLTYTSGVYTLESFAPIEYRIYSMLGQVLEAGSCRAGDMCKLGQYQSGTYMLVLNIYGEMITEKLSFF